MRLFIIASQHMRNGDMQAFTSLLTGESAAEAIGKHVTEARRRWPDHSIFGGPEASDITDAARDFTQQYPEGREERSFSIPGGAGSDGQAAKVSASTGGKE